MQGPYLRGRKGIRRQGTHSPRQAQERDELIDLRADARTTGNAIGVHPSQRAYGSEIQVAE